MGVRNAKKEELGRLEAKTLDAQFCTILQHGLNCSPFETQAVVNVVKEVYFPFLEPGGGDPGRRRCRRAGGQSGRRV